MSNRLVTVGALFAIGLASPVVHAQHIESANLTGQPLQYMASDGSIKGCGLRVIATRTTANNRIDATEVSVNLYSTGQVLIKVLAYVPFTPAEEPRTVKVTSGWARGRSSVATQPKGGKVFRGEDKRSLLYEAGLEAALSVFDAQREGQRLQVAVRRDGESTERIASGVLTLPPNEQEQLDECLHELTGKILDRAQGAASSPR